MDMRIARTGDGQFEICFKSPYTFGDIVEFHSINGHGIGKVLDIVLQEDDVCHYLVELDDGDVRGGIYADEMLLLQEATTDGGNGCDGPSG